MSEMGCNKLIYKFKKFYYLFLFSFEFLWRLIWFESSVFFKIVLEIHLSLSILILSGSLCKLPSKSNLTPFTQLLSSFLSLSLYIYIYIYIGHLWPVYHCWIYIFIFTFLTSTNLHCVTLQAANAMASNVLYITCWLNPLSFLKYFFFIFSLKLTK